MRSDVTGSGKRFADQRRHYDALAGSRQPESDRRCPVSWGSDTFWPSLRAPYQFMETWLEDQPLSGRQVLDFACGTGIFSVYPARLGASVTGVDISPRTVACARDLAASAGTGDMSAFHVANAESLPFGEACFDVVFSVGSLSCMALEPAAAEMARVLKPAGKVLVIDTLGHNPLLNWSRRQKLARGIKTRWSVEHILRLKDFQIFEKYFFVRQIVFFDLATLMLAPFGNRDVPLLRPALQALDRQILKLRPLSKWAFKFAAIFEKKP